MNKTVRRFLSLAILAMLMICIAVGCKKKEEAQGEEVQKEEVQEEVQESMEVEIEEGDESAIME